MNKYDMGLAISGDALKSFLDNASADVTSFFDDADEHYVSAEGNHLLIWVGNPMYDIDEIECRLDQLDEDSYRFTLIDEGYTMLVGHGTNDFGFDLCCRIVYKVPDKD